MIFVILIKWNGGNYMLELIAKLVAPSIAKGIIKVWLKDNVIAQSAGNSIVDLLKIKFEDFNERETVRLEFETVQNRVSNYLAELLEKEFGSLTKTQSKQVFNAVSLTIDSAELTTSTLTDFSYDAQVLTQFFLKRTGSQGGNPGKSWNEKQRTLYSLLLAEASQLITNYAPQLPDFQSEALKKLLQGDRYLVQQIDLLVDTFSSINLGVDSSNDRFELNYRKIVTQKYDRLELYGVDVNRAAKRYKLNIAYISLDLESNSHNTEHRLESEIDAEKQDCGNQLDYEDKYTNRNLLANAICNREGVLIEGPAGSGKTTLLQWLCVSTAARKHTKDFTPINSMIPVYVRLREYANNNKLPSPIELVSSITESFKDTMPEGWILSKLESGTALVMIDGIDEYPSSKREKLIEWYQDLRTLFPKSAFILTTRPWALNEEQQKELDCAEFTLSELNTELLSVFIDHWHDAVGDSFSIDEKTALSDRSARLKQTITNDSNLLKLCRTPLLCALICALNLDRNEILPSKRTRLYDSCIDMFYRREKERRVPNDLEKLEEDIKTGVLSDVSVWYLRNGLTEATIEEVETQIVNSLAGFSTETEVTASNLRKYLVERVALLRQPDPDTIDFPHRTFMEYFAALNLVENDSIREIVNKFENDQWREPTLLASGMVSPKQAERLISQLLKKERNKATLLAAECLRSFKRVSENSDLVSEVNTRVKKLIPPTTMTAAKNLAVVGNSIIPHLTHKSEYRAREEAACIRTLHLLNSREATIQLKSYIRNDITQLANKELNRGLRIEEYFEPFFEDIVQAKLLSYRTINLKYKDGTELEMYGGPIVSPRRWWKMASLESVDVDTSIYGPFAYMEFYKKGFEVNLLSPTAPACIAISDSIKAYIQESHKDLKIYYGPRKRTRYASHRRRTSISDLDIFIGRHYASIKDFDMASDFLLCIMALLLVDEEKETKLRARQQRFIRPSGMSEIDKINIMLKDMHFFNNEYLQDSDFTWDRKIYKKCFAWANKFYIPLLEEILRSRAKKVPSPELFTSEFKLEIEAIAKDFAKIIST